MMNFVTYLVMKRSKMNARHISEEYEKKVDEFFCLLKRKT